MKKEIHYKWKLGMFVSIGLLIFIVTIYLVGTQKNIFGSTFKLRTVFKSVSGLEQGNNVRFNGINVGTVDNIQIITDTTVEVDIIVQKKVQQFIKKDATASIGSDGLMGDKVLVIGPGSPSQPVIEENSVLTSEAPIDMEEIMGSVKTSVDNAKIISGQLALFTSSMNSGNGILHKLMGDPVFADDIKSTMANLHNSTDQFSKFTTKMNSGQGALSKLVADTGFANKLDSTLTNLQTGSKGLSDNMEAAKHNILLRGYFKKKKKEAEKQQQQMQDSAKAAQQDSLKAKSAFPAPKPDSSTAKDSIHTHK